MNPATRHIVSDRCAHTPDSATVRIADEVKMLRRQGKTVVDLSAGRAAEDTPSYICEAAVAALRVGDTHQTMAQGKPEFRSAAAAKLARENDIHADPDTEVIATLGCKQGLLLALMAVIDPGDEVIVEDPCFVSYRPEIAFAGGVAVPVSLEADHAFRWTAEALEGAVTDRTRAILFCSPHNPTGVVHTDTDLDVIADVARRHDLVVIADETYERLAWAGRPFISITTRPEMAHSTVNLMGLTKSFSMGGWRVGFARAPQPIIQAMTRVQQHFVTCPGSFAQAGAIAALGAVPPADILDLWQDWEARCRFVARELDGTEGLQAGMCEGGFYTWLNVQDTGLDSMDFARRLLEEKQVAVVPGHAFGPHGDGYVRVTCVKSWDEIREGVARIRELAP